MGWAGGGEAEPFIPVSGGGGYSGTWVQGIIMTETMELLWLHVYVYIYVYSCTASLVNGQSG